MSDRARARPGLVLLAVLASGVLPSGRAAAEGTGCSVFDHGHGALTALLQRTVNDGVVDYAGLKAKGEGDLLSYLRSLESNCRVDYEGWNREERIAFWVNAYNAYTLSLVLENYPVESIRSIGLLPMAAFRKTFIPLKPLWGRELSLNDIENEILRKEFNEPRIHFAIVCASKSCPKLGAQAYRADDLDRQLEEAARAFIRDPARNRFDPFSKTLSLSSIFKWFRGDFESAAGSLPEFVARYLEDPAAAALRGTNDIRIEFLDYDWSLNGR